MIIEIREEDGIVERGRRRREQEREQGRRYYLSFAQSVGCFLACTMNLIVIISMLMPLSVLLLLLMTAGDMKYMLEVAVKSPLVRDVSLVCMVYANVF